MGSSVETGKEMRGEDKVGLAEAGIDGVIREARQEVRKHQRMGMMASCAVQMSARPPGAGLWEGPSLVKPTDGTGTAAVHRSWAPLSAAQMWDRQTESCVYTWSS